MNFKNEKKRQIIFLLLVISGTIVFYCSESHKAESLSQLKYFQQEQLIDAGVRTGIYSKSNDNQKGAGSFFDRFIFHSHLKQSPSIEPKLYIIGSKKKIDSLQYLFKHLRICYLSSNRISDAKEIDKFLELLSETVSTSRFVNYSKGRM